MLLQSLKMAWEAIRSNKMRSFLTMLGIIIGVTALVVLVSLVNGATGTITDEVSALGNDMLTVTVMDSKGVPLHLSDLTAMAEDSRIAMISPSASMAATGRFGSKSENVSVYGVSPGYYSIQGQQLRTGRYIKTADLDNRSYVAVLSSEAAETFFEDSNPLGQALHLNGRSFEVVGVLEESDSLLASMVSGTAVYVPWTVESRMSGSAHISSFCVSASDSTDDAERAVEETLLARFQQDQDSYRIMNMSSISGAMETVTSALSLLLGGVAAISLLVGGIGIMNIMLVTVTERTREIGIRKAIGAGHRTILAQFLIEAMMVSVLGSLLGLVLSWGILTVATSLASSTGIVFSISPQVALLAVAFASGIGLIFGIYPANKAAKKHPIEALRYDG